MKHAALIALSTITLALASPVDGGIGPGISTCGTIVNGVECPLFATDGGGLYVVGGLHALDIGERVFVTGTVDFLCVTTCQQGSGCIVDATVAPVAVADLDCDGNVGFTDLARLLGDWGTCPAETACRSDLDHSGSVGFTDLSMVLAGWSD